MVELLGPVSVRNGDGLVSGNALGGRRGRVVLVALALSDQPVPAERLAAMVWSDDPPPTWPVALRGLVSAIRQAASAIDLGEQRLIETTPSGYTLAAAVRVDLKDDSIRTAEHLVDEDRFAAALHLVEPATLREGAALLPGEDLPWLVPYREHVNETRLRALEITVEAAGRSGDDFRATSAARQAVALAPLEERAHRALIKALDRAGDRAAAVSAYERCRFLLADQLGVDPTRETVDVYLAALGSHTPSPTGKVPAVQASFVGREAETDALAAAVAKPGLVTVIGRGGVGKSRLAQHVALAVGFDGGRFWVSLTAVANDELVASSVALALGCRIGAEDPTRTIADDLAPRGPALLALDGCELVADGVAELASALLIGCPTLTILVTSREPLGMPGELVLQVHPLPDPPDDRSAILASPAVRLLSDRVRAGGDELTIDDSTSPLIAALCARCGGLPLALELAAAQLCVMPVGDLLDHLSDVVAGDDRLRSVLRRGHALLDADEAAVFRRFAVLDGFVGLPLIKQVVANDDIAPVRVIRLLRQLTASGLLSVDSTGARWLYHQDDDVRRFAREQLAESGEGDRTFDALAEAIRSMLPEDPRSPPASFEERITEVRGSVRSLLSAAVAGEVDREAGLEIAFRLHRYWASTNVAEGRFWLSRLLAGADTEAEWTRYATYAAGYLSYWAGDADAAVVELEAAADMLREVDDSYRARALIFLGGLADDLDRGDDAIEFVRQAIEAAAPYGVDLQVSAAMGMACVLAERADPAATSFAAEAIQQCRSRGSAEQLAAAMPTAAMCCWQAGDLEATRDFVAEAWPMHAGGRRIARVVLLSAAAGLALATGDVAAAIDHGRSADAEATELGVEREVPLIRSLLARALLADGDIDGAVERAIGAVVAARTLSFDFPLALCLETAALVLLSSQPDAHQHEIALLLGVSADLRDRGDRPSPPSLAAATQGATAAFGTRGRGPLDRARIDHAAETALVLLRTRPATG